MAVEWINRYVDAIDACGPLGKQASRLTKSQHPVDFTKVGNWLASFIEELRVSVLTTISLSRYLAVVIVYIVAA